jgi:transposase
LASVRGKQTDENTKAAVMAALLAGQGVDEVSHQFKLPQSTVSTWKKEIDQARFDELRLKKAERLAELLGEYLEETLTTLTAQTIFFRNATWLKKQSASELAVLHGVQTDKALRLLEAIERANSGSEAQEETS